MNQYEINEETFMLVPTYNNKTKIIEKNREFEIDMTPYEIMEHSCGYFGSSLSGRKDGSKQILGSGYKIPVIVEESQNLIFFPTVSPKSYDCEWISLKNLQKIEQLGNNTLIIFENSKSQKTDTPYLSVKNQILRSSRLESILNKRKNI